MRWDLGTVRVGMVMATYRIYLLDTEGHVVVPARIVECADDQEAVSQARQFVDGKLIEVWRETKLIAKIEPK